ncbi:hypothetical protein ACJX0J_016949, partial [Zea mays]
MNSEYDSKPKTKHDGKVEQGNVVDDIKDDLKLSIAQTTKGKRQKDLSSCWSGLMLNLGANNYSIRRHTTRYIHSTRVSIYNLREVATTTKSNKKSITSNELVFLRAHTNFLEKLASEILKSLYLDLPTDTSGMFQEEKEKEFNFSFIKCIIKCDNSN